MPQILVVTDRDENAEGDVVYRERVSLNDLESDHFSSQLVERVGWAMLDAEELQHRRRLEAPHVGPAPALRRAAAR